MKEMKKKYYDLFLKTETMKQQTFRNLIKSHYEPKAIKLLKLFSKIHLDKKINQIILSF